MYQWAGADLAFLLRVAQLNILCLGAMPFCRLNIIATPRLFNVQTGTNRSINEYSI